MWRSILAASGHPSGSPHGATCCPDLPTPGHWDQLNYCRRYSPILSPLTLCLSGSVTELGHRVSRVVPTAASEKGTVVCVSCHHSAAKRHHWALSEGHAEAPGPSGPQSASPLAGTPAGGHRVACACGRWVPAAVGSGARALCRSAGDTCSDVTAQYHSVGQLLRIPFDWTAPPGSRYLAAFHRRSGGDAVGLTCDSRCTDTPGPGGRGRQKINTR